MCFTRNGARRYWSRGADWYHVSARDTLHRSGIRAKVLRKEALAAVALDAGNVVVIGSSHVKRTEDHVEALVSPDRILIKPYFEALPRCGVGKKHRAPFDVEDAIGRNPGDRGEDAALAARETRAA